MRDMLLVMNFDDTLSRVIARKLRTERIYCKIIPRDMPLDEIKAQQALGIVLAGGASDDPAPLYDEALVGCGIPLLGLGDTAQTLCRALGGHVGDVFLTHAVTTVNFASIPLLDGLDSCERLLTHACALGLSSDMRMIAETQDTPIGFMHNILPIYAAQFQIEQNDPDSTLILSNFALKICGCTAWWDDQAFVRRTEEEISRIVGDGEAFCAMTGGLDSGVSAMLAHKTLGDRLKCLFIDTGLLRENEVNRFMSFYHDQMGLNITLIPAADRFLQALQGLTSEKDKRRVIGATLQEILDEQAPHFASCRAVIKGTSYNDVMKGPGDRPAMCLPLPVIEPLHEFFKDEIRHIGEYLGMPYSIFSTQSFPGSGLALRIMGEVTRERLRILQTADAIFRAEVEQSGQSKRLWQYFAILSPVSDGKTPDDTAVLLRAVQATGAQMAYASRMPYDLLENVVTRILNECPQVRRVLYDLTPSPHYLGIDWQ